MSGNFEQIPVFNVKTTRLMLQFRHVLHDIKVPPICKGKQNYVFIAYLLIEVI